jgi:hypothetical protein
MPFTEIERTYLLTQQLGRLATVTPGGLPLIAPVGFQLNPKRHHRHRWTQPQLTAVSERQSQSENVGSVGNPVGGAVIRQAEASRLSGKDRFVGEV